MPRLTIMIGGKGAGKTTWCRRHLRCAGSEGRFARATIKRSAHAGIEAGRCGGTSWTQPLPRARGKQIVIKPRTRRSDTTKNLLANHKRAWDAVRPRSNKRHRTQREAGSEHRREVGAMHPDRSAASDQGRDRRGRTDAKPRVPGRANPTKTGGGKLVDLQAYAQRCDDRVEPSGKRSQPEAEQVPPVQDDRVQGPAGIRAASGPIPDTSFPRARGATWIAGAADDVEWDAPRAGIHARHRSEDLPRGTSPARAGMELLAGIERTPAERETVAWRKSLKENGL